MGELKVRSSSAPLNCVPGAQSGAVSADFREVEVRLAHSPLTAVVGPTVER
jgi:hypothetical protein